MEELLQQDQATQFIELQTTGTGNILFTSACQCLKKFTNLALAHKLGAGHNISSDDMKSGIQLYLDTSACRYFGKYLAEYSKNVSFFVSALTYVEIISPLYGSSSELDRIKSIIRVIDECAT